MTAQSAVPATLVRRVIEICGSHFTRVTGAGSGQVETEHWRRNVNIALRAVPPAEHDGYSRALVDYLNANRARFEWMWHIYGPNGLFPGRYRLVERPESYVLCERIEHNLTRLSELWAETVGEDHSLMLLREAWLHVPDGAGKD